MLTDFFIRNLDVIYFIYGFAFLLLGIFLLWQYRFIEKSEYKLLKILWLLAYFGITHGIREFISMFELVRGRTGFLIILTDAFLFISLLFLFLFGYHLIYIIKKKKPGIWFPSAILILFFAVQTYIKVNNLEYHVPWEISARYLLGFPGAILSAIGFLLYYQSESEKLSKIKVKKYFIYAALFFGIYGILGGMIVPRSNFFPASMINVTWFNSLFGIPVQIFRTIFAVGIVWSIGHIMNIFNVEETSRRRRDEEKIRDQAALLDKAQDAIIVQDLENHIIYWNKSALRLYGFTEQEAIGKNIGAILYIEESPTLIEARKRVNEEGEWTGELHQVTKAGKKIIVESRWTLVHDSEGRPKSILIINTNVTEKKEFLKDIAEHKNIEEALRMFEIALEEAPDGVRILDMKGNIIYSNKATEKIFGFSPGELKGKHVSEISDDQTFSSDDIIQTIKKMGNWNGELIVKHKNGRVFPIWLSSSMIKNKNGEPVAIVAMSRDLTDIKEKEKLQMQLLQADKLATIGQLASGVAHEINNPLGNVSLYAQMLLKKTEDEATRNKLNIINDEANRAAHIVKGLLDFARQSEPELVPLNINKEIDKVLNILKPQLMEIKVNTEFQYLPTIKGDPSQIGQVIINIISNSIQAITENGEILIKTSLKEDHIEINIIDNGCGIPEENLSKIFTPFYSTKKQGEGTGLGLAVIYGIIKRHNGSIYVKSEIGKGTTFTIKLPV